MTAKSNAREGDGVAIKRFEPRIGEYPGNHFEDAEAEMYEVSDGDYIRYSDHLTAMQAQQGAEPVACTPSSRWAANGELGPHGTRYDCERAALAMGDLSDDELANAVFLHGDTRPSMADLVSGKAMLPIAYLTAAKDRIRWLSRKLAATGAPR